MLRRTSPHKKMKKKAICLLSGGLDSTLAVRLLIDQGIDVLAVNFTSPFCLCNKRSGCKSEARKVSEEFGIKFRVVAKTWDYIEIVKNPKHGYGKNLNPCIDCRIYMLNKTKKIMEEEKASFVVTGEVLGQRPMSQHMQALKLIEKESGLEGLILRPLSAQLLPESIPEKEGWVDRQKLLNINGRSRKPQMELAKNYHINDYPCAAGGCLLTDKGFSARMRDLIKHSDFTPPFWGITNKAEQSPKRAGFTLNDIALLKVGRHFRFSPKVKFIVGRNQEENETLLKLAKPEDLCFEPAIVKGPVGIGIGTFDRNSLVLASRIMVRYSDKSPGDKVKILTEDHSSGKTDSITVSALDEDDLKQFRI